MDYELISLISIILLVLGIAGTILPVLPGLLLSLCGVLIYKFGTGSDLSMAYIWIFSLLTAASIVLNYVIPAKTNRKYGGTRWGSIGSVIGTFVASSPSLLVFLSVCLPESLSVSYSMMPATGKKPLTL